MPGFHSFLGNPISDLMWSRVLFLIGFRNHAVVMPGWILCRSVAGISVRLARILCCGSALAASLGCRLSTPCRTVSPPTTKPYASRDPQRTSNFGPRLGHAWAIDDGRVVQAIRSALTHTASAAPIAIDNPMPTGQAVQPTGRRPAPHDTSCEPTKKVAREIEPAKKVSMATSLKPWTFLWVSQDEQPLAPFPFGHQAVVSPFLEARVEDTGILRLFQSRGGRKSRFSYNNLLEASWLAVDTSVHEPGWCAGSLGVPACSIDHTYRPCGGDVRTAYRIQYGRHCTST